MKKKEAFIGIRLSQDEVERLDRHTKGQLTRSQVVRTILEDFLEKPDQQQREILFKRLFGK